ncbi:MAG: hypothetical protein GY817_04970 [bacterium]|nr:hypothetical protein [bacterium]
MDCNNKQKCSCSFTNCKHWGKCCDCIAHHRIKAQLPACYFSKDLERQAVRDIEVFIENYNKF